MRQELRFVQFVGFALLAAACTFIASTEPTPAHWAMFTFANLMAIYMALSAREDK